MTIIKNYGTSISKRYGLKSFLKEEGVLNPWDKVVIGNASAQLDNSNCGNVHISGICWTRKAQITNFIKSLNKLLEDVGDMRSHLMGTINDSQYENYGALLKSAGFEIHPGFENANSGNTCYIISKQI